MAQMKRRVTGSGTAKPKSTPMPYKPSSRKPDVEVMPYKPSSRGGTSAGPAPSVDDKIYRTMPVTEQQLKQIKKMYGIE
jgi:hypothetical protein